MVFLSAIVPLTGFLPTTNDLLDSLLIYKVWISKAASAAFRS